MIFSNYLKLSNKHISLKYSNEDFKSDSRSYNISSLKINLKY